MTDNGKQPDTLSPARWNTVAIVWARMPVWDGYEFAMLSAGRHPEPGWHPPSDHSRAGSNYEYIRRGQQANQIQRAEPPHVLIEWAQGLGIPVDEVLVKAVIETRGLTDWQAAFHVEKARAVDLAAQNDALRGELDVLKDATKGLSGQAKNTAHKLIIGMAVDSYRYDPSSSRSEVPRQISDDLLKHGIEVSTETVLKWLRDSAHKYPIKDD